MSSAANEPAATAPRDMRPILWIAGAVYVVALTVVALLRAESSSDFRDFWRTAHEFTATGAIRSDLGVHNYLPVFTILLSPLALLPLHVSLAVFTVASLAAFFHAAAMVEEELSDASGSSRSPFPVPRSLLPVLLVLPYVTSCAVVGAFGLVLLWLSVLAWRLSRRGADLTAGVLLGLAALLKLLPGLLVVYFVLRGRWRVAVGAGVVVGVVGVGVPTAVLGWEETLRQHQAFRERAVAGGSAYATIHDEKPLKTNYSNNALPMVLRRLLSPTDSGKEGDGTAGMRVNMAVAPAAVRWAIYLGVVGVLVAGSVAAGWAARRDRSGEVEAAAFGTWCALMLLLSPLVWTHYLPLAYPALACAAERASRAGVDRARVIARVALVVWLAGIACLAWPAARAGGAIMAGVVVMWLACAMGALGRHRAGQSRVVPNPDRVARDERSPG